MTNREWLWTLSGALTAVVIANVREREDLGKWLEKEHREDDENVTTQKL